MEENISSLLNSDIQNLNTIQPEGWGSIAEIHEHYLKTTNCFCIKQTHINNQLLGIGTGIDFNKTGWLAHIIVGKQFQNNGFGSLIARNRIDYLQTNRGCKTITLTATDQGYPVYKKIGFIDQSLYYILSRPKSISNTLETSSNISKINKSHYQGIEKLDKIASGEHRIALIKPILDNGFVYIKNGEVDGFYLPGFGDCGVIAQSEEAGIALLGKRVQNENKIFLPEENKTAYKYLINNGYQEIKTIHRMILGQEFVYNPQFYYSRIGGFAG
ncbi:MAG TPA: GNAT family N-acetyltransferase [Acholeplasmataceae bacterium]|nr:GNAT family N-acetyltransferase [Acholeplasmataceae bacterium]